MVCFPKFPGYPNSKAFERGFILGGMVLSCYLLPLLVISVLYTLVGLRVLKRSVPGMRGTQAQRNIHLAKVRILRMLMILTVIFAIAWLPLYCIKIYLMFGQSVGLQRKILNRYMIPIAQVLGTANSAINPFVYCYFSEQFRKSILTLLRRNTFCSWYCYLMAKFYDIN